MLLIGVCPVVLRSEGGEVCVCVWLCVCVAVCVWLEWGPGELNKRGIVLCNQTEMNTKLHNWTDYLLDA